MRTLFRVLSTDNMLSAWNLAGELIARGADISGLLVALHLDNMLSIGILSAIGVHITLNLTVSVVRAIRERHVRHIDGPIDIAHARID